MTTREPLIRDVTDTAMWTAAYRADESARPDALFRDPFAERLATERGHEIARRAKPAAVRYGVVLRTAMLDRLITRAVADGGFDTVINLAAGFDTRPYRLAVPAALRWVEVDLPAILTPKLEVLAAEKPACELEPVPLDLADREARRELLARVGAASRCTLVLSEGLLGYLEPEAVGELAADLRAQPTFTAWLTDISSGRSTRRARHGGDELKAEGQAQVRFAPDDAQAFFAAYGWREAEYYSLFYEMPNLGRDTALSKVIRTVASVGPASVRRSLQRSLGVARLEPAVALP